MFFMLRDWGFVVENFNLQKKNSHQLSLKFEPAQS